jgi:hypothetical protein
MQTQNIFCKKCIKICNFCNKEFIDINIYSNKLYKMDPRKFIAKKRIIECMVRGCKNMVCYKCILGNNVGILGYPDDLDIQQYPNYKCGSCINPCKICGFDSINYGYISHNNLCNSCEKNKNKKIKMK